MSAVDFPSIQGILRRLSEVTFSSGSIDTAEVERALQKHLRLLRLSPRPVTWARDGMQAVVHEEHGPVEIPPAITKSGWYASMTTLAKSAAGDRLKSENALLGRRARF